MPRSATTGVYTRVVNSFSQPVFGTLIDPTDADAYFDDLDVGLNPPTLTGPLTVTTGGIVFTNATSGSITLSPPTGALGTRTLTLPAATDTLVGKDTTDVLNNKSMNSPVINGGLISALTGFSLRDTSAAFNLTFTATSSPALSANRALTINVNNADRTFSLAGNVTFAGAFAQTITATATTNSTLPAGTHTLAGLDVAQNFSALQGLIGNDSPGSGYRFYRSNASDYTEIYKSASGLGAGSDPLNFYTSQAGAVVASLSRDGTFQVLLGLLSQGPTSGIGYATGAGGTVTQITSRTTGVTINKVCGAITLFAAAPAVGTWVSFTVTNSAVAATDVPHVSFKSGTNTYIGHVTAVAAGSFQISFTSIVGTASDSPVINFDIIKGVNA